MSLTRTPPHVSTDLPQIWPAAAIVIVVVLRVSADAVPAALSAVAGIVMLVLGTERRRTATADSSE
ncbi:hypothetical protein KPATCC21470_3093 [Kitasatospora purpeofusca]